MSVTTPLASTPEGDAVETVRRIVREGLRGTGAQVFLFGSRADGTVHPASDLDVAVLPRVPLPVGLLGAIREALEESTVPFTVDLVDLSDVDPAFRERVLSEVIPWAD